MCIGNFEVTLSVNASPQNEEGYGPSIKLYAKAHGLPEFDTHGPAIVCKAEELTGGRARKSNQVECTQMYLRQGHSQHQQINLLPQKRMQTIPICATKPLAWKFSLGVPSTGDYETVVTFGLWCWTRRGRVCDDIHSHGFCYTRH
jgi:hypothetical protein